LLYQNSKSLCRRIYYKYYYLTIFLEQLLKSHQKVARDHTISQRRLYLAKIVSLKKRHGLDHFHDIQYIKQLPDPIKINWLKHNCHLSLAYMNSGVARDSYLIHHVFRRDHGNHVTKSNTFHRHVTILIKHIKIINHKLAI
jgi:hypothetical protein